MADDAAESSQWKGSEVTDLINIWGDSSIQAKLEGSYRNRAVYENISRKMTECGYRRSWLQCQRKIKSIRAKYKEVKDWNKRIGRQRITCPFYEELDRILGDKPSVQPLELVDSCFVQEEPEEESPGPAAVAASVASCSFGDTGDGTLLALSPSASTCDESSAASEDTSVNSHESSTPTACMFLAVF
nr:myb/SANT-like DNA-binding domain-containing protein 2 [Misgurnus anguillicaudatus]